MKSQPPSLFFPPGILFILLGALLLSAGCTNAPGGAAGIAADYKSHISSVEDYSMTATWTMPKAGSQNIGILYKRPYQYLLRHRYDPTGEIWTESVYNLTLIGFRPGSNTADILAINTPETCFPPLQDPNRLVFPVLFSGNCNLSEHGLENMNGREAYVIDALNTGYTDYFGEGKEGKIRLWIDKEFWLVTRIQAFDSSGTLKTTFEVKNFTVNSGISDNEFIINLPDGTKVYHPKQVC